jgi:hypothetical protein
MAIFSRFALIAGEGARGPSTSLHGFLVWWAVQRARLSDNCSLASSCSANTPKLKRKTVFKMLLQPVQNSAVSGH